MKISRFLQYLQYERNFSPLTVKAYSLDLRQLADFLTAHQEAFHPESITPSDLRSWMVLLASEGCGSASVRRKMQSARAFFRWMMKQGEMDANPAAEIELAKLPKHLPHFVREENMDALLDAPLAPDADFESVRNRLIIAILYATGIRRAELIGLMDKDVDTSQCRMKVHGKRNKDRIVPFGSELCALICRYRRLRASLASPGVGELLLTKKGAALYPSLVYNVVHDELAAAGVRGAKSPHVMRHSFATAMLNDGAEINSVKQLLGHESLAATQVYTHITFSELKNNYQLAHPRALKKGG